MVEKEFKKISIHEQARIIKENQHLYTNEQLIELARNWKKDYNQYLIKNLKVLAQDI